MKLAVHGLPLGTGLSVVVPAYNEAGGIGTTVEALKRVVGELGVPYEILVVDDGSQDATAEVAEEHGVSVLRHPHRGGYGSSLKTGISRAQYELVAIIDADGTYPAEELPALFSRSHDCDMVVGARTGPYYWRSILRSPLRSLFILMVAFVTGTFIPDPNSGMRIFRRSQIIPLFPQLPKGFSFTTTTTLILTLKGAFVHFYPVAYKRRIGKSKVRRLPDALRVTQTLLEVTLRHNPLKAFLLLTLLPMSMSLLAAFFIPEEPLRWQMTTLFVAVTILVLALGMLAVVARGTPK